MTRTRAAIATILLTIPHLAHAQLRPPGNGRSIGDYTLRDFASKWLMQQDDLAEISRYADANRALLAEQDARPRTVFLGDSITELWKGIEASSDQANRWVNRGISGSNTSQMLLRFEDDVIALRPSAVVIMGGTNDLRAYVGDAGSVVDGAYARIARNLTSMADIATARGVKVVLCAIPPVGRDIDRIARDPAGIRRINAWIKRFALERNFAFVDYGAVLADPDGFLRSDLSADGIHPNPNAYEQMMQVLRDALSDGRRRR